MQNGYHVLKASCKGHRDTITVVGNFGPVHPGEELRVYGTWACHPQFGMQFHCFKYSTLKPATLKGIEKYLGSGLIKGIGPVTAKRLVTEFGIDTLDVIENHPEKLASCPGIGPFRSSRISQGFSQQKAIQDVMIFLQSHSISTAYAVKIFRKFGDDAVKKVTENPYILAYEIYGIGFKTADKIAAEFGIRGSDPRRLEAGVLFVVNQSLSDGHLFCEMSELLQKSAEMLGADDQELIRHAVEVQIGLNRLVLKEWNCRKLIYNPFAFRDEHGSVEMMGFFLANSIQINRESLLDAFESGIAAQGLKLTELQSLAVETSLKKSILIISGGPGTGKTTTLKALVAAHKFLGRRVLLASPTGRAAKRLSEVTGEQASTIHRLLDFSPQEMKFKRNNSFPLDCDTLILDEASMLDMSLFASVLRALPRGSTLVLVGDADQLPSVGPGLVLRQLIESEVVPTIILDEIFRQAESSKIIINAHKINRGEAPWLIAPGSSIPTDCYFVNAEDNEKTVSLLKEIVSRGLPKKFGYDMIRDIQVLVPMNRGHLGAGNLNRVLQEALNPPDPGKPELIHMSRTFRTGDKVIQLRNNYDLEVFNGDVGIVERIESEDQEVIISFQQGEKTYQKVDLLDLAPAYAITVHKSQGSEYGAVVMVLSTQHYMMLQRNLLYTGITRAKKTMVLLGMRRAVHMAIRNNPVQSRNTLLAELLRFRYGCKSGIS